MKILICSANFAPEPTGIGKYSGEMAAWLASRGHDVRAIAAPPYYPNWRIAENYRWPLYRREQRDGVDVWRAPIWVPRSPNGLTRVLHLLSFAVTSFPVMLRQLFWAPDLVITVAPALVCSPAALLTARLCGARAWLHIQDFEVDVAFQMGLLKGGLLQRLVLRMERSVLHRFDIVSSISGRMVERLLQKGVAQERIRYFPNWVDLAHIKPMSSSERYRARLGIAADAVVVLFSGTLGGKQGLMVIPAVAKLLAARSDVLFLICGSGMMQAELAGSQRRLAEFAVVAAAAVREPGRVAQHGGYSLAAAELGRCRSCSAIQTVGHAGQRAAGHRYLSQRDRARVRRLAMRCRGSTAGRGGPGRGGHLSDRRCCNPARAGAPRPRICRNEF